MKCPDCNTRLSEVKLEGDAWVYRCFKCGGFWIDSWTANRLTSKTLSSWRRIGVDKVWITGGNGMCPQDGLLLQRYRGESIPNNLTVSRCIRCGKWWFPGDTLFSYKPAAEAKINYFSRWGLTGDLSGLALPIISITVMIMTLGMAINYSRIRQQTTIQAEAGVRNVNFTYLGNNQLLVSFSDTQSINSISVRAEEDQLWTIIPITGQTGLYKVTLSGLVTGKNYVFSIGDKQIVYKMK